MPEYNIKISELNEVVPNPPFTEDFFPLVHSQSMTTYKATLQDIGSLMTHSIYADTASYAFLAVTASYVISASHALLADSASYYPSTQFQISCSWASSSISSSFSISASWAPQQFQISCSWASSSISSSYSISASAAISASWAPQPTIPPVILAGDVVGISSSTVVQGIQGVPVSSSVPIYGDVLSFDGTKWTPSPASSIPPDLVKAYGSFYFDTTHSSSTYRKNVMNPGSYNMMPTSSYDPSYISCSFNFLNPLSNNQYAVIMTTDALVGSIDHGNPFQILNQSVNSFLIKFEQSISGSSSGAARIPNFRLTQGSFLVVSAL